MNGLVVVLGRYKVTVNCLPLFAASVLKTIKQINHQTLMLYVGPNEHCRYFFKMPTYEPTKVVTGFRTESQIHRCLFKASSLSLINEEDQVCCVTCLCYFLF